MCGILLVVSKNKVDKKKCLKSQKFIKSRGPDKINFRFLLNNKIFLSNSILSITGKLSQKNKISSSKSKNYHLIFNGEIFNWKILSKKYKIEFAKNDSDLLINLFDKIERNRVPKVINGMFAYCVYSQKSKKIYISTDVQGEKKLFYFYNKDLFILSSNINAILSYIKKDNLNYELIDNYMNSRHFIFYDDTIYKNIKILRPGYNGTFCLKNFSLRKKIYDNPVNWISKTKYQINKRKGPKDIIKDINDDLKTQASMMIPETKFASILSGGIDSSLQTAIIGNFKKPNTVAGLNHVKKDKVADKINLFEKFLGRKIIKINLRKSDYLKDIIKCYKISCMPFLTHDFVGKYQISKYFKKFKNKVFFSADGVDELLGGYAAYKEINWNDTKNNSPYTKVKIDNNLKYKIDKLWNKVFKRYNSFLNKKDSCIQATLFTDYFVQSIYVGNIGTDIMCSYNGIEPRNIFIQKNIIKKFINLPVKYKINLSEKDKKYNLKYLLKKIFIKYYSPNLIFKKQGFSGFPNDSRELLKNNNYKFVNKCLNTNNLKLDKANEWKLLNLELFLKVNSNKIIF